MYSNENIFYLLQIYYKKIKEYKRGSSGIKAIRS